LIAVWCIFDANAIIDTNDYFMFGC